MRRYIGTLPMHLAKHLKMNKVEMFIFKYVKCETVERKYYNYTIHNSVGRSKTAKQNIQGSTIVLSTA